MEFQKAMAFFVEGRRSGRLGCNQLLMFSCKLCTEAALGQHRLSHPIYTIWGSNTGVGKTIVSTGITASAIFSSSSKPASFLYLKPLQTGFPSDSDSRFLYNKIPALFSRLNPPQSLSAFHQVMRSPHDEEEKEEEDHFNGDGLGGVVPLQRLVCRTLYTWRDAVSPHLAAQREGRSVDDSFFHQMLQSSLDQFDEEKGLTLIETAGGVSSPAPSGTLQCDLYRPFRLPAVLVGEGRLGGISGTITAFETLCLRGYDVVAIVLEDQGLGNDVSLMSYLRNRVPVITFPRIPEDISDDLIEWFENSCDVFSSLKNIMLSAHYDRRQKLVDMPKRAVEKFWWPFTQHRFAPEEIVTVIDSRGGENFSIYKSQKCDMITQQFDACASWWTQGPDLTMQMELARKMGYATARFGHVIFPENVHEPALECVELLLKGVGKGWASRVFFSDNGSTAIEISLKMAFRKFCFDHCINPRRNENVELKVLALHGSYHGDTLGAMEAQGPSSYTGFYQHPWYSGRGVYLSPPTVFMRNCSWHVSIPSEMSDTLEDLTFNSMDEIFSKGRDISKHMTEYIKYISQKFFQFSEQGDECKHIGALIIEPIVHGAGGMHMVDPLFQRTLVNECKRRNIPVIFDEVFTGFWRLGVESAAELLGCEPDIACYAKLLTGGIVPLAVTLTRSSVFDAFVGPSKHMALLHGHSYTAHPLGCTAAVFSINWFKNPETNINVSPNGVLKQLWECDVVQRISCHPNVERVIVLGTLFALELITDMHNDGRGDMQYLKVDSLVRDLREDGIYMRPLGNVIYMMCGPTTPSTTCTLLLSKLWTRLQQFGHQQFSLL